MPSICSTITPTSTMEGKDEINGLHVYHIISPTRFVCSLLPTGAIGIVEITQNDVFYDRIRDMMITPKRPATVLLAPPLPDFRWSSSKKCFEVTETLFFH